MRNTKKRYTLKKESRTKAPKIIGFTYYVFALLLLIIAANLIVVVTRGESLSTSGDIVGAIICIAFAVLALFAGIRKSYR